MRDIKERVRDKNPKIRNPAARLPKELVRSAVLEAKEKPRELHEKSSGQSDSPTQYGIEKIESVQYRAASVTGKTIGKTTYRGGKKLAGVTYRKIKERKSRQEEAKAAEEAMEQGAESGKKLIKLKPEQVALAKENGKRQVKVAPRVVKVSGLSQEKIKTQASIQKQQVEKSLQAMQKARAVQMARKSAQASAESGKAVLQVTGNGSKLSVQGITAAIQKGVVALEKMGKWIAAGGGAFLLVFILIAGIIAGAAFSSSSESSESLSDEVLAYTSVIQQYASQYGIPEYVSAIQAIMMQESGGRGTDPMQCSESPYNTRFSHSPGSITDPNYSIEVGVQTFADCISQAGCSSPQDMDKLKLAWQGYNYGNGYIRASEVCTLKGNAYYQQGEDYWIQVYQVKMKNYKRIPIPQALYQIMKVYLKKHEIQPEEFIFKNSRGGACLYGTFRTQMIEACRENKIANGEYLFQSHDYRHTVATMFYDSHVSLQSIRDYLGHTYEEMTRQYIDYMPQRIAKANDEFFEMQGSSLASWLKKEEKDGK